MLTHTYLLVATLICLGVAVAAYFLMEYRSLVRVALFAVVAMLVVNPLVYSWGVVSATNQDATFGDLVNGVDISAGAYVLMGFINLIVVSIMFRALWVSSQYR